MEYKLVPEDNITTAFISEYDHRESAISAALTLAVTHKTDVSIYRFLGVAKHKVMYEEVDGEKD